jgi:hypothetical protein
MKTLLKFLFRRPKRTSWLGVYLASYNTSFFQTPGIRYFRAGLGDH